MAKRKVPPLPKAVIFRFGRRTYDTDVKVVPKHELQEALGELPARCDHCGKMQSAGPVDPSRETFGCLVRIDGKQTVLISSALSVAARWDILEHELDHAWTDAKLDFRYDSGMGRT